MTTFDTASKYYSGQGVVMLADRDLLGNPKGLVPVGNVSSLKLTGATSVIEHKESQSGQRAIDLRLTTESKVGIELVMESFSPENLAIALRASVSNILGANVTGKSVKGYLGKITALPYLQVSATAIKRGVTTLTAYVNDSTPWDYILNAGAGSFRLNDGLSGQLVDKITTGGTAPSAIAVSTASGLPTKVTCANTCAVGDYAVFTGFAGADAALLNGKAFQVVAGTTTTDVYINIDTFGKTITVGTPLSFFDGQAVSADYTYANQTQADGLVLPTPEKWVRFEGLNTADSNRAVVVETFRVGVDIFKELLLIGDTIGQFSLVGSVYYDATKVSGSKYFREQFV